MRILIVSPKFHPIIGGGKTFVLNSIEQLHAAGQTIFMRRPFIGADAQGINGFIRDHENGLLVPMCTAKELASAIEELTNDHSAQQRYTDRAAKDVAHLAWSVQLPHLLELYQTAVSN